MILSKLSRSLSVRLQSVAAFLSLVGVSFGVKSYLHVEEKFGSDASALFLNDLIFQIVVALAVNVLVAVILYRIATKPIQRLGESMHALTEDDLDVEIPYTKDGTEIGSMARNVKIFKMALCEKRERAAQDSKEQQAKSQRQERMENLISDFDKKISAVLQTVSLAGKQLFNAASSVLASASNTDICTKAVAESINSASDNTRAVSAAAEELSASIREISSQVNRSTSISETAVQQTQNADLIVQELTRVADKVGAVVTLIGDIAAQINLLALNASIEAARAGAAGRGFAVVASEVKSLAGETTKATEEIAVQIDEIQKVSRNVATALSQVRSTILDMNNISTSIASSVQEQGAATNEIARNIQNATMLVSDVSSSMDKVQQSSVETDAAAKQVSEASKMLTSQSGQMEEAVASFLSDIRE